MRNQKLLVPGVLFLCVLGSCNQSSEPPPTATATPQFVVEASDTVGQTGGTVQVTNPASTLFGVRVIIPAGALSNKTLITISSVSPPPSVPSNLQSRGPYAEFGPEGLTFNMPVTITMTSSSSNLTNKSDLMYDYVGDGFRPVSTTDSTAESHGQRANPQNRTITITALHFSGRQPLGSSAIENMINNFSGTLGDPILIPVDVAKCLRCKPRTDPITRIIIHSTNDGGAQFANIIAWIQGSIGDSRKVYNDANDTRGHYAEAFFASYYIDKDGRIVQLVDENIQTAHIANQNRGSIGIELFDGGSGYTPRQIEALDSLTRRLMVHHQVPPDSVRRHKDYTNDLLHQDPYRWTDNDWNAFTSRLASGSSPLAGSWSGTWGWSGPGSNGCFFNDGGSLSMSLSQSGTSFSGSNVSATGIETRDDADCHLMYMDMASGGTASGTISGNTVTIAFNFPTVTLGTTLYFTGTATLGNNTLNGSIVRSTGGSGSITLTRQ